MALVFYEAAQRKAVEDEIEALALAAAKDGRALNAQREAERLSQRYPQMCSIDEFASMVIRAGSRVAGSAIELGTHEDGDRAG